MGQRHPRRCLQIVLGPQQEVEDALSDFERERPNPVRTLQHTRITPRAVEEGFEPVAARPARIPALGRPVVVDGHATVGAPDGSALYQRRVRPET